MRLSAITMQTNYKMQNVCINNYFMKPVYEKQHCDIIYFHGVNQCLTAEKLPLEKFKLIAKEKIASINNKNRFSVVSEFTEVLDKFLQGAWNNTAQAGKYNVVINALKQILGKRGSGNIAMAQINPISGNVEANALSIMKYIKSAEQIGLDAIIFPELSLMGYPIQDTIDRHPVIVDENIQWLKEIAKQTKKTNAIIGFVEPNLTKSEGKQYYNSVAVLGNGKILGITRKSLLPTYGEFNDKRYMQESPVCGNQPAETLCNFNSDNISNCSKLININGHNYGIVICEDGWNNKQFFSNKRLYDKDPVKELMEEQPETIINCSASPSRIGKEYLKNQMLSYSAKSYNTPFVYINQVGALDDSSFDGASRVYGTNGELLSRAKSFKEQFMIINPFENSGKIYELPKGLDKINSLQKSFSLDYENDLGRTYETIVQGIRDYFNKTGIKKAVLGLSGGLDSTVSAVLVADAIGAENVYGISMPSKITSKESRTDAEILAKNLGIHFDEVPIKGMVDATNEALNPLFDRMEKNWEGRYKQSFVQDNIQARSRATILWGMSNAYGGVTPIATSDKSELYMGYATINGDMSGGFAPLADVTKTKLFALARWLNKNRVQKNTIPEAVIAKPPGAELAIDPKTGKPLVAEDALMPYEFLDEVIWRIENNNETYNSMLKSDFVYEKTHNVSKEQKEAWLNKFYKRMSSALFKWSLLPPSVIVDGHSINKSDYKQPITSGSINYKQEGNKEIAKKLKKII
ncbi:MAG: NAD(+) synthase [bacterium]|nr:NAD(+) synthase [bacterium]